MSFFETKKQINWPNVFLGIIFFGASLTIFHIFAVDFSPIIVGALLLIYAKFVRKTEHLPTYADLAILAALAIIISFVTVFGFSLSAYWISAIGFVMLVTILFDNLELSAFFAVFASGLAASVDKGNFGLFMSFLAATLVAAMLSYRARRREQIITAGSVAGLVLFFTAFILERGQNFLSSGGFDWEFLKICLINGLVSSFVVLGILSIFEYVFKVVTNIKLLELSDFNQPLLRRLIIDAPGTYQHSIVVANLSEAAAESIGANALLARVGSYYHDIGKMIKPQYFVENQSIPKDVHRDLKPSMSKLIIINHVKDGVELARKDHLNPRIIDFISQHHGRSLVYYFYYRAKELEPGVRHEEEYRYPGPKPQTKEAAIVSLADTLEALSRLVDEPTPARIEEMVRDIVRKKFMEGELDESDLTLKDLERITESFIRMLNAIFHTRINYPKDKEETSKDAELKKNNGKSQK